jgi:hypothetical protein
MAASSDAAGVEPPPPYRGAAGSIVVRVGLETDLDRVVVPCCETVWIEHGGARRAVAGGLEARPGGKAKEPVYKLQAAALKDEDQARALASVLARSTAAEASVSFDVASSLYRVRLGRFPSRDAADRFRQRVADQGLAAGWGALPFQQGFAWMPVIIPRAPITCWSSFLPVFRPLTF